ncbi:MAG TPA: IgGFc-binding protein [Kofleriaceae bacterium]|jgi:hypothetical protein|nr:IgGFc-binding protein [Kofleriaceae bacterium]
MHCNGNVLQTCVDGNFKDGETCPQACSDTLGCTLCVPGTGTCNGSVSHVCNAAGTGYDDVTCDPVQGSTCDAGSGLCTGPCAPAAIGKSYIGCEYYPTITGNEVGDGFGFAVAVSNTSTAPANITIEDGGMSSAITFTVQPGDVKTQILPWNALKLCNDPGSYAECGPTQTKSDLMMAKGAFHLRSTQPVTVYQFSPLDYTSGGGFSYTNDASLLIPTNAWTGSYVTASAAAWTFFSGDVYPGEMAVTASRDNTHVTITTKTSTPGGTGIPAFQTGVPGNITLNRGDVLELQAYVGDLTGTLVAADAPVQVIGAHDCTYMPQTTAACDHLEESIFPVETLSTKYIIAAPSLPASGFENGKVEIIRIVGTAAGTTLTYDPPQSGAPTTLPDGGYVEIVGNAQSFFVTANHKILVAQYMEGQDAGGGMGDPAMALAVATDQYRSSYLFHAPTNYTSNFVQVTAPTGATVMLDGAPVSATFTPIGGSGFGVARVALSNTGTGNHSMSGTMPFGIQVYGYGQYTSYWYPGGLNLADIPVN